MTPERWQQIKTLFHQALQREPIARIAFIAATTGGDTVLRWEVESLLAALESERDRFEKPAFELAAHLLEDVAPWR